MSPSLNSQPIAVFDSGVGGLTVLHELLVSLPSEDFIYLGDTANFPYGTKSQDQLIELTTKVLTHLLKQQPKVVVVACNSATAAALPVLQELALKQAGVTVLGVIEPEARLAVAATANQRVGLLATPATVASGAYQRTVTKLDPMVQLTAVPCPDLAPIIQNGFPFNQEVVQTVRSYCTPLIAAGVDTVILGCTHYPLVAPMLQRMLGRGVRLIAAGSAMATRVGDLLDDQELATIHQGEGSYRFLCTGELESFRELGSRFLQLPLTDIDTAKL